MSMHVAPCDGLRLVSDEYELIALQEQSLRLATNRLVHGEDVRMKLVRVRRAKVFVVEIRVSRFARLGRVYCLSGIEEMTIDQISYLARYREVMDWLLLLVQVESVKLVGELHFWVRHDSEAGKFGQEREEDVVLDFVQAASISMEYKRPSNSPEAI